MEWWSGGIAEFRHAVTPALHHLTRLMAEPIVYQKFPTVQNVDPGTYWWCACGRSATQPFCDGSHRGTGLGPIKVDLTAAKPVAWCGCKHSKNKPYCDGTHSSLK